MSDRVGGTYVAKFEGLSWDGNWDGNSKFDNVLLVNPELRRFSFKVIYLAKVFH